MYNGVYKVYTYTYYSTIYTYYPHLLLVLMAKVTTKFYKIKFLFVPWLYISLKLLGFNSSSLDQQ